jgi:decaprenyl-phosphate phosphoribosyltransferase
MKVKEVINLIRPHQWIKNGFILLPIFFSQKITDWSLLKNAILTLFAFCLTASSIYCFNDICDAAKDRLHPVKCKRPIASGSISSSVGLFIMAILIFFSFLLLSFTPEHHFLLYLTFLIYLVINVGYSLGIKNVSIVEMFVVASGFVIRIVAGALSTDTRPSNWIIIITFLLSLFLVIAKRRDDYLLIQKGGMNTRKSVAYYDLTFLNVTMTMVASITIVCYILYCVYGDEISNHSDNMYVTSLFVIIGFLRYMQISIVKKTSANPALILLHDHFLQIDILLWLSSLFLILYV